ncbi:MAG: LytTR family transcriptional regulator [Proteobacteria bacterium]|nr:LytTR family transcriptional regulator [Pseudomonadota bacterium]
MRDASCGMVLPPRPRLLEFAIGFAFWLGLVVVLEPGNILRAGGALPLGREVARLTAAGLLGALVTPVVFALARRWPVEGEARWARATLHAGCDAGLAILLIVLGGILAWLIGFDRRPLLVALESQLVVDGLLLFFAVVALDGIAHAALFYRRAQSAADPPLPPASGYLSQVTVKARGTMTILPLADVAWIEAQGNYLALHAGGAVHLIRETLAKFESRLDPERFVRIHRGSIVALTRVRTIETLPGGDAMVMLEGGDAVRMSRSYRDTVAARISTTRH